MVFALNRSTFVKIYTIDKSSINYEYSMNKLRVDRSLILAPGRYHSFAGCKEAAKLQGRVEEGKRSKKGRGKGGKQGVQRQRLIVEIEGRHAINRSV